jgi:hypothetical protein
MRFFVPWSPVLKPMLRGRYEPSLELVVLLLVAALAAAAILGR